MIIFHQCIESDSIRIFDSEFLERDSFVEIVPSEQYSGQCDDSVHYGGLHTGRIADARPEDESVGYVFSHISVFKISRSFYIREHRRMIILLLKRPRLFEVAAPHAAFRFRHHFKIQHPAYLLARSEEHTSELQSRFDLVCRLL